MSDRTTVNVTISVTPAERKALKQAALDYDVSLSSLIRIWLREYVERRGKAEEQQM